MAWGLAGRVIATKGPTGGNSSRRGGSPGRGGAVAAARGGAGPRPGRPRAHEFVFARLRYDSGDWDYNPKVAANVLNSVVEYTSIPVYPEEVVITADSEELRRLPVPVHDRPQAGPLQRAGARAARARYVEQGGLLFSDDCNHDVDGLYATSFEEEMRRIFPGPRHAGQDPEHPSALSRASSRSPTARRRPRTS